MALTIFFALLLWTSHVTTGSKIRCSVPSVVSGESATLTCYFTENVQQGRKEFLVHYYADDQSFKEIISCHWFTIDKNSDKPECKPKPGYVYGELDNTTFTLKIRTVTEKDVGKYQCQQLPSDPTRTETCSFTLKAAEEKASTSSASSTSSAVRTEEETKYDSTLLIVVLAVLGGILVAAVVVIFICRKRLLARYRQCRNRSEESGVSFSKSAGGNGSVVGDEQSAPMLDETTAPTENETTKSEPSVQPASGEVISENTAEESPLIQPSKVPEESSAVVSVGSEKTSTGQAVLSPQKDTTARVKTDTANIESSKTPAISKVTNENPVVSSPLGQALKMLDETGAVIIAGPEKFENTKIGQDIMRHYKGEGYKPLQLPNPRKWPQYKTDRENKYLVVMEESFKTDPTVSEHGWCSCFNQIRERQWPVVVLVRSSEEQEEKMKADLFPFLRSIPIIFPPAAAQTESKETLPSRRDMAPSCGGSSRGVQIFKGHAEPKHDFSVAEAHGTQSSSEKPAATCQNADLKNGATQSPNGKTATEARAFSHPKVGSNEDDVRKGEVERGHENVDLVMRYVPESKQKNPGLALEEEIATAKNILKETGISDSELNEVIEAVRLGEERKDGDRRGPRPLRITVKTYATKQKILENADKVHVTGARGRKVRIVEFETKMQQTKVG